MPRLRLLCMPRSCSYQVLEATFPPLAEGNMPAVQNRQLATHKIDPFTRDQQAQMESRNLMKGAWRVHFSNLVGWTRTAVGRSQARQGPYPHQNGQISSRLVSSSRTVQPTREIAVLSYKH